MRILVDHRTSYSYDMPATGVVQLLRLTPGDHEGQHVRHWRVDVDVDGGLRDGVDAFGNVTTVFYADAPVSSLTLTVTGEVDVEDTAGVIRAPESLPAMVYRRSTNLTAADQPIRDLAARASQSSPLASLHQLMGLIHGELRFDVAATDARTSASEALVAGHGVCQDFTHIFCSAARLLGAPARYVSGHLAREGHAPQDASHAWAEALVPDLGWIGFDPANGICTTDAYLRVAIGLDYLDAAPVRGARRGGGTESMHVQVQAGDSMSQSQS